MKKPCWSAMKVVVVVVVVVSVICMNEKVALAAEQDEEDELFPAIFVLGDSLIDSGNNNYLRSLAKANYVPYGIDFNQGRPTGRFSNGKTIVDFLGELIGLPLLPTFEETFKGADAVNGVNYASAAAGILDKTGQNLVWRTTLRQMKKTKPTEEYLSKSSIVMNLGSNDYINNYLMPSFYNTSSTFNPTQYALLLITHYATHIMELQNLGVRKFLLAAIGPLGCIPNQLARGFAPPGKCVIHVNVMIEEFNKGLISLLFINLTPTILLLLLLLSLAILMLLLLTYCTTPHSYGCLIDKTCCGIGRHKGQISCLPFAIPCLNRDQYIFWDAYHPTQAFNQIIAQKTFNGGLPVCYPMNVKQMAGV